MVVEGDLVVVWVGECEGLFEGVVDWVYDDGVVVGDEGVVDGLYVGCMELDGCVDVWLVDVGEVGVLSDVL